jgi:hypothetical protein
MKVPNTHTSLFLQATLYELQVSALLRSSFFSASQSGRKPSNCEETSYLIFRHTRRSRGRQTRRFTKAIRVGDEVIM